MILRREVVALLGRAAVCAWPLAARAAMQELGRNDGSVYVYFFGGYRSTISDVDAWGKSLEAKVSGTTAIVFPYPPGASAGDPLAGWGYSQDVAMHIVARGNEPCMIIGHSSGCAIANDVAKAALDLGAKNFSLISLDGFRPSPELLSLPGTTVWSAECNGARSLNYDALSSCKQFRVYNPKVIGQWPLHFSLVNLNVSDDYDQITDGYRACEANTEVLGL